ncbi:MAG: hypothetical protein V1804_02580 [Patescibacteria group bacterium]
MSNFGEQPTSPNRERFDKNEESAEDVKKQLQEAMAAGDADKIIELGGQMKTLKGKKEQFGGEDKEEANVEDAERKVYDEAKAEDNERTMYDEAKKEDVARGKVKLTEAAEIQAKEDAIKAEEVLKKIQGTSGKNVKQEDNPEIPIKKESVAEKNQEAFSPEVQKYIDSMPVESGTYMSNYLQFDVPKELMGNEKFLLKVAEVNPAAAYQGALEELKHNKEFIIKLMKSQPRAETDKVNYHRIDFYEIERETPELLYDKDAAMALIERNDDHRGRLGSMRVEMLKDKDIYEAVVQEGISELVEQAEEFAKRKSGGYAMVPDFKVRDGSTSGGERWSLMNDKNFMEKAANAVSGIVKVSMRNKEMYFEPKV